MMRCRHLLLKSSRSPCGRHPRRQRLGPAANAVPSIVTAHALGGPVYIAPAGGVRLGFNGGKIGLLLGIRPVVAFGNLTTFAVEPDVGIQIGF